LNLKHLYYFWKVAKSGGLVKGAKALHLTPQTVSGQLRLLEDALGVELFDRGGRTMAVSQAGRLAMEYADEIFSLDAELEQTLRTTPKGRKLTFNVGVSDAVPKTLAYRLLRPAVLEPTQVRIICREWRLDRLLSELALHKLDMVIADSPIPSKINVRGYNHRLGSTTLSVLAPVALLPEHEWAFPVCLDKMPMLLPGEDSSIRRILVSWFEKFNVTPTITGEFDDLALMIAFAHEGASAFVVPTAIEAETLSQGHFKLVGRIESARVDYFAITVERRVTHRCVKAIIESVCSELTPAPTVRRAREKAANRMIDVIR
jgi:LysR family transcriptional activator of nhaA